MRALSLLLIVSLAGCAAPAPVIEPVIEPVEVLGPRLDVLNITVSGIVLERRPDRGTSMISTAKRIGGTALSPDGRHVAIWGVTDTQAFVDLLDRSDGAVRRAWEGLVGADVSMAWAPDGAALYIGHRASTASGLERVALQGAGSAVPVGCSASNEVLAVRPDGSLVVRGGGNLYVVSSDDCATIRTIDARKYHHVTASPDGRYLAYILRDLVYNRVERTYEPDSTLYLEPTASGDPVKVIGDRYNPRNLSWSPDSRLLGYDVLLQDGSGQRTVSSYSIAEGRSGYVVAPGSLAGSATHVRFAPDGVRVAFRVDGEWTTRGGPGTFATPFPREASPQDFHWVGRDRVAARYEAGAGILDLANGTTEEWVPGAWWVWPAFGTE